MQALCKNVRLESSVVPEVYTSKSSFASFQGDEYRAASNVRLCWAYVSIENHGTALPVKVVDRKIASGSSVSI